MSHRAEFVSVLEVKEVEQFETYLELPTLVGRARYQTFSYLKDRVWKKLQGWKGCLLSSYPDLYHGCVPLACEIV